MLGDKLHHRGFVGPDGEGPGTICRACDRGDPTCLCSWSRSQSCGRSVRFGLLIDGSLALHGTGGMASPSPRGGLRGDMSRRAAEAASARAAAARTVTQLSAQGHSARLLKELEAQAQAQGLSLDELYELASKMPSSTACLLRSGRRVRRLSVGGEELCSFV